MIDLEQKYIDFIKETVSNYLNEYKLYFFGSRVKNKAKKFSDIDIAIDSAELTFEKKSLLKFLFEDSTMPYEVDIVDLNKVTDKFKELITADLVQI